jgi:cytochrome c oxidase assembly protein subunit 15
MVTLCFTFPLIFLGGLVTSHHAGMSVPDWPNSYGYNMFLFPPSQWTGGILFEHTHRLLGTVVGFCATVLTLVAWGPARSARGRRWLAWVAGGLFVANGVGTAAMVLFPDAFHLPATARSAGAIVPQGAVTAAGIALTAGVAWCCRRREPRPWVRWLATGCLAAVCVQGLLGGLRVDLRNLPLAMVHGCFAQLTFCLMVVTTAVTGRAWDNLRQSRAVPARGERSSRLAQPTWDEGAAGPARDAGSARHGPTRPGSVRGSVHLVACATVMVVLAQLVVAAVMRHSDAGLAIPELLLPYGHLLPPTNSAELAVANHHRIWDLHMDPVTMGQVWLQFAHRLGAVVVTLFVSWLIVAVLRSREPALVTPAAWLGALLAAQVTLGLLTVHYGKPADVASAHVACGALVLATSVLIAVRASRLYVLRSPGRAVPAAGDLVAV